MTRKPRKTRTTRSRSARKKTRAVARRARPVTRLKPDALDVFIDAAARALELPLRSGWKPAIKTNLQVTLQLAATVAEFSLPDDAEPAPVFRA